LQGDRKVVAVLDDQHADGTNVADVGETLCRAIEARSLDCVTILAAWGKPSADALDVLRQRVGTRLVAIVSVQEFVVGGTGARAAPTRSIEQRDVRVVEAVGLRDVTEAAWRLSEQGLSWESVYYRISMPELQGVSQPMVIAAPAAAQVDSLTGIEVSR